MQEKIKQGNRQKKTIQRKKGQEIPRGPDSPLSWKSPGNRPQRKKLTKCCPEGKLNQNPMREEENFQDKIRTKEEDPEKQNQILQNTKILL